jgi:hypothetical protein
MRASCWLLLCAGWAAIAYYLLMPISRVAMFAFSGVGALFVLAAIVDSRTFTQCSVSFLFHLIYLNFVKSI